jgi:hypothetical protein
LYGFHVLPDTAKSKLYEKHQLEIMERFELFDLTAVDIGYAFCLQRERKHLTIRQVALGTKLSQGAISKFESGVQDLSIGKMRTLADFLNFKIKLCIIH